MKIMNHEGQRDTTHKEPSKELKEFLINEGEGNIVGLMDIVYQMVVHENFKNILELGTGRGVSTRVFGEATRITAGNIVTVDLIDYGNFTPTNVHFIKCNTNDTKPIINKLKELNMLPLDCLLIDADHTKHAIIQDIENWGNLVKKGGIIFMHDVCLIDNECEAYIVWNEYDFSEYEKLTLPWSNGLGLLRKQ